MRLKNILFAAFCVLGLLSCYEDKGNYDYDPVNQAGVSNLAKEYNCMRGEALSIIPYVTYTQQQDDPGAYSYLWLATSANKDHKVDTIGRERKLEYFINLVQGEYLLEFVIHDVRHDVDWRTAATLKVTLSAPEGWLFMEDNNGKADISMLARMGNGSKVFLEQLLSKSGVPAEALEGPRQVFNVHRINKGGKGIWFVTDKMTGFLDVKSGLLWNDAQVIKNHILEPVGDNYTVDQIVRPLMSMDLLFFNQGEMHYSFQNNVIFSGDLCRLDGQSFKVAPYVATGGPMGKYYLMYDVTNKRFLHFEQKSFMGGSSMSFKKVMGFPAGYELIRMDCFQAGMGVTTYAALKGSDGVYEAVMLAPDQKPAKLDLLGNSSNIMNAEHYAYHQKNHLLYYSLGEKLFVSREGQEFPVTVQEEDPKTGRLSDYQIEGKITCMVTRPFENSGLYDYLAEYVTVATELADGTGRVYFLHPEADQGTAHKTILRGVTKTAHKVVSISYQDKE